jgi:hypothetical protein
MVTTNTNQSEKSASANLRLSFVSGDIRCVVKGAKHKKVVPTANSQALPSR